MKALIGVTVLSLVSILLSIPFAASAADLDPAAAAKPAETQAAVPSLDRQLAPSPSTPSDEIGPGDDSRIFLATERCTTTTTCNTSVVCIQPDGSEGALGVTKRTCCPICQTFPCQIQQCHTDVIGFFCGCS